MATTTICLDELTTIEQVQFALSILEDHGVLSDDESADLLISYADQHQIDLSE